MTQLGRDAEKSSPSWLRFSSTLSLSLALEVILPVSMSDTPFRRPSLAFEEQGENLHIISDNELEKLFIGNSTGRRVLELSDGQRTVADIAEAIWSRFPQENRDQVTQDVTTFLASANEIGLIAWKPGSTSL